MVHNREIRLASSAYAYVHTHARGVLLARPQSSRRSKVISAMSSETETETEEEIGLREVREDDDSWGERRALVEGRVRRL